METLGKIFHMNFLEYVHWFMSIRIYHTKDHSISVYQDTYSTFIVDKYLDTSTVKTSANVYKTTFPYDLLITNNDVSTSDKKVENLTRELIIHYRACIGSLIYLLSKSVDLNFVVH